MKNTDGKLVSFDGGNKDNAIPRECAASLIYADAEEVKKAEELACSLAETLADEITPYEENFACEITSEEGRTADALRDEDAEAFVTAMYLAPNGVQSRNMKLDGFVVTSVNMGIVRSEADKLSLPSTAESIRDGATEKSLRSGKCSARVIASCSAKSLRQKRFTQDWSADCSLTRSRGWTRSQWDRRCTMCTRRRNISRSIPLRDSTCC